jgi:hypothetical protein
MAPTSPDNPISFDDVESFELTIGTAEIAIGMDALTVLMNDWVFAYDDAPLRDFSFETDDDGRLVMSGKLDKVIDIGFEIESDLELVPSGEIRARPHDIDVLGFIGGGFLDAIGLSLEDMVDTRSAAGVRVDGNDLYLDPLRILPPPAMTGTITAFRVEPGRLVQVFGDTTDAQMPADEGTARNFMRFDGGTLSFGKLTMADAILVVIDQDPADPLDFSIENYALQLVAGYSRTRKDLGLDVYMPDLDDVRRGADAAVAPPRSDSPVRETARPVVERNVEKVRPWSVTSYWQRLHADRRNAQLGAMSRAFVNEDAAGEPDPQYSLPEPDSPYYAEAAAWALIEGANRGDTRGAELATGYRWGDRTLLEHVRAIEQQAEEQNDRRTAQLARRYLRAAS